MKILKLVVVLCTTYVSGAPQFQYSADKPATDDRRFPINQPDYVGGNRDVLDVRGQPYNRGNIRGPENMKQSYADQPREKDAIMDNNPTDNRGPLNNENLNSNHRQFGDREQQRNPYHREPLDYRRPPDNKINPIRHAPPNYRIPPDNRQSLNNRELQDKRMPSDFVGSPENRKPLNDIPPNRDPINIGGPPSRREMPDMKDEIGNRDINNIRGFLYDREQSNNKGIPENRGPFVDHGDVNDVKYNSWDQNGIRRPPDSKDPLNYRDLPDNGNPSSNKGPQDTKSEGTKVSLDNIDQSNNTNKEYNIKEIDLKTALEQIMRENKGENNQIYIIGNMSSENDKENIKISKLVQSSMLEANSSSSNLQNSNFESTDSATNTSTTSTFSPFLQATAVTPAS